MRAVILASFLLTSVALPAVADSSNGKILAFDRVAQILVLDDKTVWTLAPDLALPDDLVAGDKISIDFKSDGDNGVAKINSIVRQEN